MRWRSDFAPAPPKIIKQPESVIASVGDVVTFSVEAVNVSRYRWQYSRDGGGTWNNLSWDGCNTNTTTCELTEARMSFLLRCRIDGNDGSTIYTDVVGINQA